MHIYMITRGIKKCVDQLITELQGKYLQYKFPAWKGDSAVVNKKGEFGKLQNGVVQLGVIPIQFWEIRCPAESKDAVLATLFPNGTGESQHKRHNKFIWMIRKVLGLDKPCKFKTDQKLAVCHEGTETIFVGTKPDYWIDKNGTHLPASYENPKPGEAIEGL